jgi:hypothetical protein
MVRAVGRTAFKSKPSKPEARAGYRVVGLSGLNDFPGGTAGKPGILAVLFHPQNYE